MANKSYTNSYEYDFIPNILSIINGSFESTSTFQMFLLAINFISAACTPLTPFDGVITSPNYPVEYPHDLDMCWTISNQETVSGIYKTIFILRQFEYDDEMTSE